jgi:hypothetical protein
MGGVWTIPALLNLASMPELFKHGSYAMAQYKVARIYLVWRQDYIDRRGRFFARDRLEETVSEIRFISRLE